MDLNFIEFFIDFFYKFIDVARTIWDFLFETHHLGFSLLGKDIGYDLNVFGAVIGGGFVAFIVLKLIKTFIPGA